MPLRENVQACADKYGISIRKLEQQLHIANKSISTWNEHLPGSITVGVSSGSCQIIVNSQK